VDSRHSDANYSKNHSNNRSVFDSTQKLQPLLPSSSFNIDEADSASLVFSHDILLEDEQLSDYYNSARYLPIMTSCKHIESCVSMDPDFDYEKMVYGQRCQSCGAEMEVWLCLVCLLQFCGRYQNSHMLEHHNDSAHCVTMNLADLSVWCYGCDMYLQHEEYPPLSQFFSRLHYLRHKEEPMNAKIGTRSGYRNSSHIIENKNSFPIACAEIGSATDVYKNVNGVAQGCAACAANNILPNATGNAYREDWMCLTCGGVYCGRYHNKHGLHHFHITGHPLALSFVDVSIWCYHCMEYIDHNLSPSLVGAVNHVTKLKDAVAIIQQ
jgi:hypothetical protein